MQYTSPLYLKRSPYRLYRPYQLETQQATIPGSSTSLYRTPNLNILSEINRRSRRLERVVSYQKILTIAQILFSLLLMLLKVTKILLMWGHFDNWEQRLALVSEIFQPILFAAAAFLTLYSVLRPTKNTSQIAIASLIATLVPLFLFPTQSPFVINAIEAMHLSRLIDRPSSTSTDELSASSFGIRDLERLQRITHVPIIMPSNNAKTQNWKSIATFRPVPSSSTSSRATASVQQLHTLQYSLLAYASFSFLYFIVLLMTLISYVQLIQLQ